MNSTLGSVVPLAMFACKSPYLKEQAQKLVLIDAQDYVDTVSVDTNVETVLTG